MLSRGGDEFEGVDLMATTLVEFCDVLFLNTPAGDVGSNTERSYKPHILIGEELSRLHIAVIVVIMGDDQEVDLQQILELQRRLHFREFILEHPFDASLELSLNNRKGEAIFPKVFMLSGFRLKNSSSFGYNDILVTTQLNKLPTFLITK